jgi:single-strand DNA-binding protein
MRVVATGRLRQRSYETKEGEKRTSIELEVDEIGPSLRYATAQVTRASSGGAGGGGGSFNGGGQRGGQSAVEEPWAASAPSTSSNGGGGNDVWNTPGSYADDTPF